MPADTSVKFLHSGQTGAPTLNGTAGALIGLLDACLLNGFGAGALDSLAVAAGVATATRSAGHPFEVGSVVAISGASVSGGSINGQHRVTAVTSTSYQFEVTGLSDQTATGAITHKLAPLGFEKPFSGANLAAYRSPNVAGTRMVLRVDDADAYSGRVVGYESMTDINTGSGAFPAAAQINGGGHWPKSASANSTARGWVICGDDRGFLIQTDGMSGGSRCTHYFGDIQSVKTPDPYACLLACSNVALTNYSLSSSELFYHGTEYYSFEPRAVTGLGGAVTSYRTAPFIALAGALSSSVSGAAGPTYPNLGDGGLYAVKINVSDLGPQLNRRGQIPGVYFIPMTLGASAFNHLERISDVVGLSGRTLRALRIGSSSGWGLVDMTGPWR